MSEVGVDVCIGDVEVVVLNNIFHIIIFSIQYKLCQNEKLQERSVAGEGEGLEIGLVKPIPWLNPTVFYPVEQILLTPDTAIEF